MEQLKSNSNKFKYNIYCVDDSKNKMFSMDINFLGEQNRLCLRILNFLKENIQKYDLQILKATLEMQDIWTPSTTLLKIYFNEYKPELYENIYHEIYLFIEYPEKYK